MKLSIIIVSWNVRDDLIACLRSIEKNRPGNEYEIIVIDNASSDDTVEMVRANFPKVKLIINTGNRGFAAASNQGLKIANGEYVFLLNPDTLVHSNSLDNLVRTLDENPTVGVCGPKLIDSNGAFHPPTGTGYDPTSFRAVLYSKTILRPLGIFRKHHNKPTKDNFACDKQTEVGQLSGAAIMTRRSVIEQIGGMDENFFMYHEDVDLCLRIRQAGYKIVYVPESVITHTQGRSSMQVSAEKQIIFYRSLFIYFRKYRGRFATWLFGLVFKPGVITKEIINLFSGIITCFIFFVLRKQKAQLKSLAKIKKTANFVGKHSWEFLFRV